MPTLKIHAIGTWSPGQVIAEWAPETRRIVPEIETAIESAWREALSRPGVYLHDGPMCRLESFEAAAVLQLKISRTSYRIFVGTNQTNPHFPTDSMANPIGVSSIVHSLDGFLMLGRRNASVVYYPNRVHPFAGSMEPADVPDVFAEVQRELQEELGFQPLQITSILCLGVVEDFSLRHPELIFRVDSNRTRWQIESELDAREHTGALAIPIQPDKVAAAVGDSALTPVAAASLLLWGRQHFGRKWFDAAAASTNLLTS